jgi:hypothetical protein
MLRQKYLLRVIASVAALYAFKMINTAHEIISPLITGPLAAQQLTDSSPSYVESQVASRFFDGSGVSVLILVAALGWIWYTPIKNFFTTNKEAA